MRRQVVVAGLVAVAVVAAFAVGGVLVARSRPPQRLPALAPTATAQQAGADQQAGAAVPSIADRAPEPDGTTVVYKTAGPLPKLPDQARAWVLDAAVTGDQVAALAHTLGLPGRVSQDGNGFTVTDATRSLRVAKTAGAPWSFGPRLPRCLPPGPLAAPSQAPGIASRYPPAGIACGAAAAGGAGGGAAAGGVGGGVAGTVRPCPLGGCPTSRHGQVQRQASAVCPLGTKDGSAGVACGPVPRPVRPAGLPTQAEAERIARELLGRLGVGLDGAAVEVIDGVTRWEVVADPTVGGQPTSGFGWRVSVGSQGRIESAGGWLATPRQADVYPLIGVSKGIERLQRDGAWWAGGPYGNLRVWPPIRCGKAACPAPPDRAPVVRTITDVRLGLQLALVLDRSGRPPARAYLVPAYFFAVRELPGRRLPVIAVADRFLTPPPAPLPATTGPAAKGSGSSATTTR